MKHDIEIVSDGTAAGTFVFTGEGEPIKGVTSVEIPKFKYNELVTATLTFENIKLKLKAKVTEKTFLHGVLDILHGIDIEQSETENGWWETSSGG